MWIENDVFKEDLEYINHVDFIHWDFLDDKTFFITGSTGLIGFYFANALLYHNLICGTNIKLLLLVRDLQKAKQLYSKQIEQMGEYLKFKVGSVEKIPSIKEKVDYIFHGASPTASEYFVNNPVETIKTSVIGSLNILELAMQKNVKGMVYLSSMEIYGNHKTEEKISEQELAHLDPLKTRDSYPISKCLVENLNNSYSVEYKVPVCSLRISQVVGAIQNPLNSKDNRLIMQLARALVLNKNIVLNTKGESKRTYIYIADVVTAALTVFTKSNIPKVLNVSNETTYSSVYELCKLVSQELSRGRVHVIVKEKKTNKYPQTNFLNLSSACLHNLGWKPSKGIKEMFLSLIRQAKGDMSVNEFIE